MFSKSLLSTCKKLSRNNCMRLISTDINIPSLYNELKLGNKRALSKALTLIESNNKEHIKLANQLINLISSENNCNNFRIGVTGPPGAGKSTFIDKYGSYLLSESNASNNNYNLAVLAIDPSSINSGGSILGDQTRMLNLSSSIYNHKSFIRPSPSGNTLLSQGGVNVYNAHNSINICEAAGYNRILVETVGVGQSEVAITNCVDMVLVFINPAAGDEIQGLKKGILEIADLVIITKNDGLFKTNAHNTYQQYNSAITLMNNNKYYNVGWNPKVLLYSAIENNIASNDFEGFDNVVKNIENFFSQMRSNGELVKKRTKQKKSIFKQLLQNNIIKDFYSKHIDFIKQVEKELEISSNNTINPRQAVDKVLSHCNEF